MNLDHHPHATDLARLRKLAQRMDSAFRVPVLGIRVGWDSVFGLVPVVGDALTLVPSIFILRESLRLGASKSIMARMGLNVGIDLAIGAIPLVGDVFDIGWRSNTRNVDLLHSHLAQQGRVGPLPDQSVTDTP
jgi:predicted signal transduction protein with EAL and GGDEF domain